jgi:hypothetical protein
MWSGPSLVDLLDSSDVEDDQNDKRHPHNAAFEEFSNVVVDLAHEVSKRHKIEAARKRFQRSGDPENDAWEASLLVRRQLEVEKAGSAIAALDITLSRQTDLEGRLLGAQASYYDYQSH